MEKKAKFRDMRDRIFSTGDPPPCKAMGEEKAPGAIHKDEPVRPRNKGSGRSVSIVNLDVLYCGEYIGKEPVIFHSM